MEPGVCFVHRMFVSEMHLRSVSLYLLFSCSHWCFFIPGERVNASIWRLYGLNTIRSRNYRRPTVGFLRGAALQKAFETAHLDED